MAILPELLPLRYADARPLIKTGDLLLWEPTSLMGLLIAKYSDGPFSHVASASWCGGILETHEMLQWYGGRTVNLSAMVRMYPGRIHVYRARKLHNREFSEAQRRRAGESYGWGTLLAAGINKLLGIGRRIHLCNVNPEYKDKDSLWEALYRTPLDHPAICSEAVASDLRRAGCQIYPELAAWEITPNMIADATGYLFTLFWEDN